MSPLQYGDFVVLADDQGRPLLLGEGSSGTTFKAVRREEVFGGIIETFVAVKVIKPGRLDSARQQEQFVRELEVLTKVRSNHVVRYVQQGSANGESYYVMEFCSGGDLEKYCSDRGGLTPAEIAYFGRQAAEGLAAVHEVGFVHCDVKPANLLLDVMPGVQRPQVKLSDFGSVQKRSLCEPGTTAETSLSGEPFRGSPMFASPEQLRQHRLDQRSDIYSLGMTFWFLLLGRRPLETSSKAEVENWHLDPRPHQVLLPDSVPDELAQMVAWMVEKDPARRPASFAEVLDLLAPLAANLPAGAHEMGGRRDGQTLESILQIDYSKRVTSCFGYRCPAVHIRAGEPVDVLFIHPEYASHKEVVEQHLTLVEEASLASEAPPGLLRVHGHGWFGDDLVVMSDPRNTKSLAAFLRENTTAGILPVDEALSLVEPLAEALDYLGERKLAGVSLGLNDILISQLTGPHGRASTVTSTITTVADHGPVRTLLAQMDPLIYPPGSLVQKSSAPSTGDTTRTITSSSPMWSLSSNVELPGLIALAGLIYRLLVGHEVPEAAQHTVGAFTPTQKLGSQSNLLLRNTIASQRGAPATCVALVRGILENEDLRCPPPVRINRTPPLVLRRGGSVGRTGGSSTTYGTSGPQMPPEKISPPKPPLVVVPGGMDTIEAPLPPPPVTESAGVPSWTQIPPPPLPEVVAGPGLPDSRPGPSPILGGRVPVGPPLGGVPSVPVSPPPPPPPPPVSMPVGVAPPAPIPMAPRKTKTLAIAMAVAGTALLAAAAGIIIANRPKPVLPTPVVDPVPIQKNTNPPEGTSGGKTGPDTTGNSAKTNEKPGGTEAKVADIPLVKEVCFVNEVPAGCTLFVNKKPIPVNRWASVSLGPDFPKASDLQIEVKPPPGFTGSKTITQSPWKADENGVIRVTETIQFSRATGSITVFGNADYTHARVEWVGPLEAEAAGVGPAGPAPLEPRAFDGAEFKVRFDGLPTGRYRVSLCYPTAPQGVTVDDFLLDANATVDARTSSPVLQPPPAWSGNSVRVCNFNYKPPGADQKMMAFHREIVIAPGFRSGSASDSYAAAEALRGGGESAVEWEKGDTYEIRNLVLASDGRLTATLRPRPRQGPPPFAERMALVRGDGGEIARFSPDPGDEEGKKYPNYQIQTPIGVKK